MNQASFKVEGVRKVLVTNLSSLHIALPGGRAWCFMEEHCRKGPFTATYHRSLAISANSCHTKTKEQKLSTSVPGDVFLQRVIATGKGRRLECKEAAHSWWKQQTGGRGKQAWKGSIHWREVLWWMGWRNARLAPRDWEQFSQCQSGRNKWLR